MKYRFVKIANVVLPVGPSSAGRKFRHNNGVGCLLLSAAIGLAAVPIILLGALLAGGKSSPVPIATRSGSAARTLQQLEIIQLEQETSVWAELRSYGPLLSAMIALSIGAFGAYKYFRDQDRDYALRVDQEISSNLSQLLDFAKETGSQNARIASSLDNLLWLITQAREPVRQIGRITSGIVTAIKEDIDLESAREARFPALCLEHWPDYTESFKSDKAIQRLLLYRYNQALAKLAENTPEYFAVVEFSKGKTFVAPEDVNSTISEKDYQFFVTLVDGLWQHLGKIDNREIRKEAITDFQNSLHNTHLPDQLLRRSRASIQGINN